MPNAQVVADRFHVMTQINKELDIARKKEKRKIEELINKAKLPAQKANYEKILSGLKNSKYPLLKNEDSLNEEQALKLIEVKNVSPVIKEMHELKEKIIKIFNRTNDWYTAVFKIGMWLSIAKKYFPKSNNTIIRSINDESISPKRPLITSFAHFNASFCTIS